MLVQILVSQLLKQAVSVGYYSRSVGPYVQFYCLQAKALFA